MLYSVGNAVALAAVLVVNYIAATTGLNGLKTGEISDGIKSLFTPAGYVFSIWGLIYLLLIIFVIAELIPKSRDEKILEKIGLWFMVSCFFNIAWMFSWHYGQILLSLFVIICLFLSLMVIYLKVGKNASDSPDNNCFYVRAPFSIYFGWLSVAVVANTSAFLVKTSWNGFGIAPEIWTVTVLIIAAVIAIATTIIRKDILYPLVFVWAFIGIAVVNSGTQLIVWSAYILAGLIFFGAIYTLIKGLSKTS